MFKSLISGVIAVYAAAVQHIKSFDWLASLLLRLYLAPIFIIAGYNKLQFSSPDASFFHGFLPDPNVVSWFGNADWGLGLPFPELLVFLAAWTEFLGGWLLLVGLLTRLVSLPLIFTMLIAATTAHWGNGWFAIAPSNPDTSAARVLHWVGIPGAQESLQNSNEVGQRLSAMKNILKNNGKPSWLYEKGGIVVLNNGIEFAATYLIMLLSLLMLGGGRWVSLDYWFCRYFFRGSSLSLK